MTLTSNEVDGYLGCGFAGPFNALSEEDLVRFRQELESFEALQGALLSELPGQIRAKTHLILPWMQELIRQPLILDAVQSIIGPNILVYHVTCWVKEPGDHAYVSWHQDSAYFFLDPPEHVTAWIALSDATKKSGCLKVLPGSHHNGPLHHNKGDPLNNLLSNGQYVDAKGLDAAEFLEVRAGQFTLHHTDLVHSSAPNHSADRRIGIGVSYIPTHVRCNHGHRLTATLVRGQDRYNYFDHEEPPRDVFEARAVAHHADATQRFFSNHGSERTRTTDEQ